MNYPDWVGQIIYLEKRYQLAVMALIALFAVFVFANQAVTFSKLLRSDTPTTAAQVDISSHPKPVPKVVAAVALFGNPSIAAEAAANKNLPTTNLQLVLRGVVVESSASDSHAMIEEPSKPALPYKIGDTLPGGVVLNAVFDDHVVLKRNGQLETLNFPAQSKLNIKDNERVHANKENMHPAQTPDTTQQGAPAPNAVPQSIQERLKQLQQQHGQR